MKNTMQKHTTLFFLEMLLYIHWFRYSVGYYSEALDKYVRIWLTERYWDCAKTGVQAVDIWHTKYIFTVNVTSFYIVSIFVLIWLLKLFLEGYLNKKYLSIHIKTAVMQWGVWTEYFSFNVSICENQCFNRLLKLIICTNQFLMKTYCFHEIVIYIYTTKRKQKLSFRSILFLNIATRLK